MNIKSVKEYFQSIAKGFSKSKRAVTAAAALGMIGMLMILFSGGKSNEDNSGSSEESISQTEGVSWTDYSADTERRLESILSAIEGAGKVEVMVTAGSSEEYIYAVSDYENNGRKECGYVILKKGADEEALVAKVISPEITGVVVVCEGAGSDIVREKIYFAVISALNVPSNRVYVAKMK